jgi:hypothetical protein
MGGFVGDDATPDELAALDDAAALDVATEVRGEVTLLVRGSMPTGPRPGHAASNTANTIAVRDAALGIRTCVSQRPWRS